jgi:catechol 2,3-dioxygenase-like lactoylglutathione lyase family enzyme
MAILTYNINPTEEFSMIYRFHHIHLLCSNLQNSIDFFTQTLGATLVTLKKFGTAEGAELNFDGIMINLRVAREDEPVNTDSSLPTYGYHHICVQVEDIDATYNEITEKGYEFTAGPVDAGSNRIAFFKGPDDIVIEVLQVG